MNAKAANGSDEMPSLRHELEGLQQEWYWFLALGILLIISGTLAIGYPAIFTFGVVKFLGFLLVIGGGAQVVASFWTGKWSGFLLSLLAGVLYIVVGATIVTRPFIAEEVLTVLIGSFFLVGGIFRIMASMSLRLHHWGWMLLNGVVTAFLGLLVLAQLPQAAFWVIGLLLGVDMIFNGWAWVMLSLGLKNILPAKN